MTPILVALDVDSSDAARQLARSLRGVVGGFKIGKRLFTSEGPSLVRELVDQGDKIFLDLKFHDIPNTVAGAVAEATKLGVWMMDVHASGGSAMMRAARAAADDTASARGQAPPLVIAVTVLTSFDQDTLSEVGVPASIETQVGRLAELAESSGLDGVVASPLEIALIRSRTRRPFAIVTPGIRSTADAKGDQQRTLTAAQALSAGADYLVVGRPIIAAADPRRAADALAADCRAAGAS
jgi:orotidine-5'-phosphate decarboxylase